MRRACKTRLGKRVGGRPITRVAELTYSDVKELSCPTLPRAVEGSERRRILVADEHPLFRYGLQAFFDAQRDLISSGEANSAQSLKTA